MKIAIIGYSCSGKTTLTHALAKLYPDHSIFHTDEYAAFGFHQAMYACMHDIQNTRTENIIVEGIHSYRLLRKGAELNNLFFDLIIHCRVQHEVRLERYLKERGASTIQAISAFDRSLDKIYNDYTMMCQKLGRIPKVIDYWT